MKLSAVMKNIDYTVLQGNDDIEIKKIVYDSRQTEKNDVFVCISGFKVDGHDFASGAVEKGAAVVIVEKKIDLPTEVTVLKVENNRIALAQMGANYYNEPSKRMNLIGVTGTNGKTSTTYIIKSVLDRINHKVGIIGTIENRIGDEVIHTERTTPESLEVQKLFKEMYEEHVTDVVMEVSSHALDLHRVDCCDYNIAIFTNLTQDHLDYHKTMENYKLAKAMLLERTNKAVINIDDPAGEYMISVSKGKVITTAIEKNADLKAEKIKITADGVSFVLDYEGKEYPVHLNIPGKFSIYNALGSIGACLFMDIPMETVIEGIGAIAGVKGRFQSIKSPKGANAVVDYAHTPDSLENILKTAKEFVEGRIITVFGCGGDRDRTKRPIMGEIAGKLSDYCIITSDNPRSEEPNAIILDVEEGTKRTNCPYVKIVDRREAIFTAVKMSQRGDLVVVAGKGHESYQIFADKTIHFDDAEVVAEAFEEEQ
ncbi:MAG: UDP-N-acetylmuramoyl-L-alanyl-D-glutamate--2,6-diaminopimelate ligase [Lachnospiraceae bacterium]|nr:UDP-N-acetylmuramoyl-L-alanyl-D-glutamate--2,6-diaminopimelate ligase [Lachnospiraceae bacterium]